MTGSACISVDLDGLACYRAIFGGDDGPIDHDPILTTGVERLLDFFAGLDVPVTLFCIGDTLGHWGLDTRLAAAAKAGHELANHTQSHFYDLRSRDPVTIEAEIKDAELAIMDVAGRRPVGFRTPGYNIAPSISGILDRRGYRYDSSIFPCPPYWVAKGAAMGALELAGKPSRSQMTKLATLTSPLGPYRCDPDRPWGRDGGGVWQLPVAVVPGLRLPVIGTSLHLLGRTGFATAEPLMRLRSPRLFNLVFHALDFVDDSDHPELGRLASKQPDLKIDIGQKLSLYRSVVGTLRDHWQLRTLRGAVGALDGITT